MYPKLLLMGCRCFSYSVITENGQEKELLKTLEELRGNHGTLESLARK